MRAPLHSLIETPYEDGHLCFSKTLLSAVSLLQPSGHLITTGGLLPWRGNLAGISIRGEEIEKPLEMAAKYDQPEAKQFFRQKPEMGKLMAQVENLQSLGKDDTAIRILKEYLVANPNSQSTDAVERWLDYLQEE